MQVKLKKHYFILQGVSIDLGEATEPITVMFALVAVLSHLHDCANFLDEEYEEVTDLIFTFSRSVESPVYVT